YASAKDLSQVVGNTLRNTQFLPFIRYNVVYNASQKSLDVKSASNIPGSTLWQYNVNDTEAQHFSFEDAGDGYFYIRTHCGNLYVTVDVPGPIVAPNPNIIAAPTLSYNIKQDTKYRPGNVPDLNHNPAYQKWKMTPVNTISHNLFIISNAFFPDKVLQPINNTGSGVAVVVGDKTPGGGATNAWKISSPLINNQIVVNL
ncbi:MAG: RICIN domain-containing protein, partial [Bacteroidia bacterium]